MSSSVNPCVGKLVWIGLATVAPVWAIWPWNTCKLRKGFQVCLILKYYLSALQPHSPHSPVRVQWEDLKQRVDLVLLLACNVFLPKICSRTGRWGCECYPSDCSLVPDNFLEGAVATMWLLPSSGLTGFSKRFQFCHPRLSHCPNALDKKFVSCIGPQIPQQSPGRASVYPPLQSIKRSLNVNILIWNLFSVALVHQALVFSRKSTC